MWRNRLVFEADLVCPSICADLDGLRGGVPDISGRGFEFRYHITARLQVRHKDFTVTGAPLVGAKFFVEKQNGEYVGEYTTDKTGTIFLKHTRQGL